MSLMPAAEVTRFGHCTLIPSERKLLKHDEAVAIGERALSVLIALVDAAGAIVTKDALMEKVWPGRIVEENTIEAQISAIRKVLGDDRSMIRTLSGRGYQFTGKLVMDTNASGLDARQHQTSASTMSLPVGLSPLYGRARALQELAEITSAHRLVTLSGTGGVGKTRLAFAAARERQNDYPAGSFVAEFAPVAAESAVLPTIAAALGLVARDNTLTVEWIAGEISDKSLLLVVDNCEHLVGAIGAVLYRLLSFAPQLRVIATSRQPLQIEGEYVYRVPSLDTPPVGGGVVFNQTEYGALQLLNARIGYASNVEADSDIFLLKAHICRRLDGIPLAIELAAGRVALFGIKGVADRLDDQFALLTKGARSSLPRQQTLRATLDWSFELLSATEQEVFAGLGVFVEPFSLAAALDVAGSAAMSEDTFLESLEGLVQKSLLYTMTFERGVRYFLLETTRVYARGRLDSQNLLEAVQRKHAAVCLAFSRAGQRLDAAPVIEESRFIGLDDVRAALSFSFSHRGNLAIGAELTIVSVPRFLFNARLEESAEYVKLALQRLDDSHPSAPEWRMKLLFARGSAMIHSAQRIDGDDYRQCYLLAKRLGDVEYQMRGLWGWWACTYLRAHYQEALPIARLYQHTEKEVERDGPHSISHRVLGVSYLCAGEIEPAWQSISSFLKEYQPPPARAHLVRYYLDQQMSGSATLAFIEWHLGRADDALTTVQRSVQYALTADHLSSECFVFSEGLAVIALLRGDDELLRDAVTQLVQAAERHGSNSWRIRESMWLGLLQMRSTDSMDGYEKVGRALENLGEGRFYITMMGMISALALHLGEHGFISEGRRWIDEGLASALKSGDRIFKAEFLRVRGELTLMEDSSLCEAVVRDFANATSIAAAGGFTALELRAASSLARQYQRTRRPRMAHDVLQPVYAKFGQGFQTADCIAAQAILAATAS